MQGAVALTVGRASRLCPSHLGVICMERGLGVVILLWPLLVGLTVLAVLASLGWVRKRFLRALGWIVHKY